MTTPPLSRSLPVLALYNAAVRLGLFTPAKRRRPEPSKKFGQLELPR